MAGDSLEMENRQDNDVTQPPDSSLMVSNRLPTYLERLIRLNAVRERTENKFHRMVRVVIEESSVAVDEMHALEEQNRRLKEQLDEAHSKIFSLQPFLKVLTPEEAGNDFDSLVGGIENWVWVFTDHWSEDPEEVIDQLDIELPERQADVSAFVEELTEHVDLIRASSWPGVDIDIICSMIVRFIELHIFDTLLLGYENEFASAIERVCQDLQAQSQPKTDPTFIQNWRAEAYNSILADPSFQESRAIRIKELSSALSSTLAIFCQPERFEDFRLGFETQCILPAVSLHEKMLATIGDFSFELKPFVSRDDDKIVSHYAEFLENLADMDCQNIAEDRRKVDVSQIEGKISDKKLRDKPWPVCPTRPAMIMRQVSETYDQVQPLIVRRQEMLVALGSKRQLQTFCRSQKSVVNALLLQSWKT